MDEATNTTIDCISAGADTVRVVASNHDTGETFVDLFDCRANQGATARVDAGDYSVVVDLLNCGADTSCRTPVLVASSPTIGTFAIFSDVDIDLGDFVFVVPAA